MVRNLPIGLRHVLEVYRLVRKSGWPRNKAINEVAIKQRIDPQTVRSACTRSLGIKIKDFQYYLLPQNAESFKDLLIKRFPAFQNEVEIFFDDILEREMVDKNDPIRHLRTLFPEEQMDILKSVLLNDIQNKFQAWTERKEEI